MVNLEDQDMGEGMGCITHPYTKNPGGICALCLQDKLGKLVTSSFPLSKPDLTSSSSTSLSSSANLIYKRSKSTAATYGESFSQRKRSGFWSFLHLYSSKPQATTKNVSHSSRPRNQIDNGRHQTADTSNQVVAGGIDVIAESPNNKVIVETPTNSVGNGSSGGSSFGRKVLRSRSVGCGGKRSFSSERISNEFGDCALRRIESQREPTKVISNGGDEAADAMSEMVKCGGIFGGFMIMTPSSSSSTVDDHRHHKMRNKSPWGWASPMRAKTTQSRTTTKSSTDKKTSPKLDSVPSLVTMKS